MLVRQAVLEDAEDISEFLTELASVGKRRLPCDPEYVRSNYVAHPDNIRCNVVEDTDQTLLGLQILKIASDQNPYGVAVGWGIIGTHVRPSAARRGVGKALFAVTRSAAVDAGLRQIDATIGATNAEGLAYYNSIGFETYRTPEGKVCKVFNVSA